MDTNLCGHKSEYPTQLEPNSQNVKIIKLYTVYYYTL